MTGGNITESLCSPHLYQSQIQKPISKWQKLEILTRGKANSELTISLAKFSPTKAKMNKPLANRGPCGCWALHEVGEIS